MNAFNTTLDFKSRSPNRKLNSCRLLEDVITTFIGTPIRLCQDTSIEMLNQIIPQEETD
jgi:hypothetical protein